MKKYVFLSIVISSVSFSFYKFEPKEFENWIPSRGPNNYEKVHTPYLFEDVLLISDPITKFYMTTSPKKLNLVHENNNSIFFDKSFSDHIASFSTGYKVIESSEDKDPIADFLACNFNYDHKTFWNLDNLEQYGSINSGRCIGPILLGNPYSKNGANSKCKKILHESQGIYLPKDWRTRYLSKEEWHKIYNITNNNVKYSDFELTKESNWYEEKIRDISNFIEYITYYSKETEEKYPLYLNKKPFTPAEDYNLKNWHLTPIKLRQTISLKDKNIDIVNEDKVTLYKKDENGNIIKQIDLQQTLLDYFNPNYFHTRFAQQLKQEQNLDATFSSLQASTAAYAKTHLNHPRLKKENYELLQNSTILAVWDISTKAFPRVEVISQPGFYSRKIYDEPVPFIFVGLASDSEGQLFHWVTDLNANIEILFSLEGPK